MAQDIERRFSGTNFAVITLMVLLVLVGIYLFSAQTADVMNDTPATAPAATQDAPTAQ